MTNKKKKATTKKSFTKKTGAPSGLGMVKQEPEVYSWDDLVRDGKTAWTGVRNFQARNNLRQMNVGHRVLFYHSVTGKCLIGIELVARAAYPDAIADDTQLFAVYL